MVIVDASDGPMFVKKVLHLFAISFLSVIILPCNIVTNELALLSKFGQPVRKVIQTPYCVFQAGKHTFKDRPICAIIWCIVNIGNGYELNNIKGKTD